MTDREYSAHKADWLERLRGRMLDIARRRVPADEVEDLVQGALRVIVERVRAIGEGLDQLGATHPDCGRYLRDLLRQKGVLP